MKKPWGNMSPNSEHQIWSRWTFRVYGKHVPLEDAKENAKRWLSMGFGSVGRARVFREAPGTVVVIEAEVEGVPVHDPGFVTSVRQQFRRFVDQGWGPLAAFTLDTCPLAGDLGDGKPRAQIVVVGGVDGN